MNTTTTTCRYTRLRFIIEQPEAPASGPVLANRAERRHPSITDLLTTEEAGREYRVTSRTIRNWASRGLITAYLLPNGRSIRVSRSEIAMMLRVVPTTSSTRRAKVRSPLSTLGPDATVVTLPYQAEVVE